jgi:hypothetical protein
MEFDILAQPTRTYWRNLLTIVSVMILVGVEVLGVAIAGGWALAGLFELGTYLGFALVGLFSLFGLYLLAVLWRHCVAVEPVGGRA